MRFRWLLLTASFACGHMPPDQAMAELRNPEPVARQHAADALRGDDMSPQSVQALMDVVRSEQDPKARAAMVISLGASGSPQAKPVVDDYVARASNHHKHPYS